MVVSPLSRNGFVQLARKIMRHLDFVPLTVKAVHRTPFCSDCCVPDNAFPSLLNCQSMRDVTTAPSGPVATPSSVVVVLSKVAVRAQLHPSPENPETVSIFLTGS